MQHDRLIITLPWPDTSLMPNRKNGRHWGGTQAAKVRARQDGYFGAKKALGTSELVSQDRMPVKITFVAPDGRRRDIDNMLAKQQVIVAARRQGAVIQINLYSSIPGRDCRG